ncbi:hypothetical protein SLEP1_g4813 [Rubroshorea leprosula]|uniref:Uncharacterized protein n=1 Tax=Rubroshorea leprosula TaxID=152421 RepID=A0AAV5HZE5_9ROSI|nr:hypothetical protein SLEP1_g4813 [Rubroshorea leprosula]
MSFEETFSVGGEEEVKSLSLSSSSSSSGGTGKGAMTNGKRWWGRRDGKVEEFSRWKGKKKNPNQHWLGEVEKDEVERSSLSGEEMTHLRAGGKAIRLLEKRSKTSALAAVEERVRGGTSRPHHNGGARVKIELSLWEIEVVVPGKGKSSVPYLRQVSSFYESRRTATKRFISFHFLEVDLQRARDEVATNGGLAVVRQALKTANLASAMAVEFFDCLQERIALVGKNEELSHQKEAAEKNFNELTLELEKVREELFQEGCQTGRAEEEEVREALAKRDNELAEVVDLYRLPTLVMAFIDCRKKVKTQNLEVDVTNITFGPEETGVEENGDSKTAEFRPAVKLAWERDEAGKTILPPTLEFEFIPSTRRRPRFHQKPRWQIRNSFTPSVYKYISTRVRYFGYYIWAFLVLHQVVETCFEVDESYLSKDEWTLFKKSRFSLSNWSFRVASKWLTVTPQNPNSRRDRRRALVRGSHKCTRLGTYPLHI